MFGEEIIVTNRLLKLDPKKRITIPAETKVEFGEKIYPMFSPLREYLILYNEQDFLKAIDAYKNLFDRYRQEGKVDAKKYRNLLRYLYATLCFAEEQVDKQHRIVLPKSVVEQMKLNSTIYAVGRQNHLELYKDEASYQAILSKRK